MSDTLFVNLLDLPVKDKANWLQSSIDGIRQGESKERVFAKDPREFHQIPGTPFAYWAPHSVLAIFEELPPLKEMYQAKAGLQTSDDFRFLRVWWEVAPEEKLVSNSPITERGRWARFAKGGEYSPYFSNIHLLVDWGSDGKAIKEYPAAYVRNEGYYLRPGVTWTPRTAKGLNLRTLPGDCLFANKGPAIFTEAGSEEQLLRLLGLTNSLPFKALVGLQMTVGSYEIGVIQRTAVPRALHEIDARLVDRAYDLTLHTQRGDETTYSFGIPSLIREDGMTLNAADTQLETDQQKSLRQYDQVQRELDEQVFELYGLSERDKEWIRAEASHPHLEAVGQEGEDDDEDVASGSEDLPLRVQNLLMWCVGVAFGRWDIRFALEPDLLPELQGPFDSLPRVAPGGLVGPDALPAKPEAIASEAWLAARDNVLHIPEPPLPSGAPSILPAGAYPLPVAWDGILVDDPTHPSDIVGRIRDALALLWGDRAGAIEQEACDILGVNSLRDYIRDPRNGFFAFHIKRYSKSRRKAPIYWLLQSANRNYAIWLYIHRMDDSSYYTAARDYADTKVNLETARLEELREGLLALSGSAQKRRERDIEQQERLVDEVTTFRNTLDKIALLGLPPDLNDGVVIGIAPLHELVPWNEADKYWQALLDGEYEWSTMARRMRERGLVK